MELNREKLKRMFEDTKGNGGSANGGGGGGSLAGYATQAWVNEGFVSIEFFNRLFTVYGPGETSSDPDVVVEPNDLDSTIKNIKAMFGLWTEQYLSALGLNPGGTGSATSLGMLDDVDITTPTNGQALVYNSTSLKWENQTISTVTALANLTDVLLTSPAANQVLVYDGAKWVNSSVKTVNGYSIFGTGDIPASGGGTGNYLPLAGGTMTGIITFSNIYPCIRSSYNGSVQMNLGYYPPFDMTYLNCGTMELRLYKDGRIEWGNYNSSMNTVWTSGNDGSGSGLDADLLDGHHASYFATADGYLPLTGGTLSNTLSGVAVLKINNNLSGDYNRALEITLPNMLSSNFASPIIFGRGDSTNDKATISFFYRGHNSNTNAMGFGFWANDNKFIIQADGNVGIGTTTPVAPLDVMNNNGNMIRLQTTADASYCCINYYVPNSSELWSVGTRNDIFYFYNSNYSNILHVIKRNGYVGILTTSPSYTLHVSGSIYATGAITALSDIKQKNVEQYDAHLGFDEVANAPIIKFTWKDPKAEDKGLQVGSIAQYWEKVLPEAVKRDKEGTLSMSYGVVALVAAVSTAKKVQDHEQRIADLERENKELKVRLRRLNRYGKQ